MVWVLYDMDLRQEGVKKQNVSFENLNKANQITMIIDRILVIHNFLNKLKNFENYNANLEEKCILPKKALLKAQES